jgi:septal ring factor EnvC (AmiA/AmiB activator)
MFDDSTSSKIRNNDNQLSRQHVAFQLKSRFSSDFEVIALDHRNKNHEETISILKCLSHRLRIRKEHQSNTMKERLEKLTKEVEYLRQELIYYKDTRQALMKFFESIDKSQRMIESVLRETSRNVTIFEQL